MEEVFTYEVREGWLVTLNRIEASTIPEWKPEKPKPKVRYKAKIEITIY